MPRPKRLKLAKPAALAMAEASLIPLEQPAQAHPPSDVGQALTSVAACAPIPSGMATRVSSALRSARAAVLVAGCAGAEEAGAARAGLGVSSRRPTRSPS